MEAVLSPRPPPVVSHMVQCPTNVGQTKVLQLFRNWVSAAAGPDVVWSHVSGPVVFRDDGTRDRGWRTKVQQNQEDFKWTRLEDEDLFVSFCHVVR